MNNLVIRPSGLALFLHCPASVELGERASAAGLVEPPTENMERGSRIHAAVAGRTTEALAEDERASAEYAIRALDRMRHDDGDAPATVEAPYSVPLPGCTLRGRIDVWWRRQDGTFVIVDIKTGSRRSSGWLQHAYRHQMAGYAVLLAAHHKALAIETWLVWADEQHSEMLARFTDHELSDYCDLIQEAVSCRNRLVPGPWCIYCRGAALCPAYARQMELLSVQAASEDTPVTRWIAAKRLERLATKVIASTRRSVENMSDEALRAHGIRRVVRQSHDICDLTADGIRVLLERLGRYAGDVMDISMPKLQRALKSIGMENADLAALAILEEAGARVVPKSTTIYQVDEGDTLHDYWKACNGGKQAGISDTKT